MSIIGQRKNTRYKSTKEYDEVLFVDKKSTGELFPVVSIDRSGIFALNNDKYSKTYKITDINYEGVTEEEKGDIVYNFSGVIKTLSTSRFSYTVASEAFDSKSFRQNTVLQMKDDGLDYIRENFNEIISEKILSKGLTKTIYLTLTIQATSFDEAKLIFEGMEFEINKTLHNVSLKGMNGSEINAIDINTRMQLWYNMTHLYLGEEYEFDFDREYKQGHDFINIVSPYKMDVYDTYFIMNDCTYGTALAIDEYPKSLSSEIMYNLTDTDCVSYVTVASEPLEKNALMRETNHKLGLVNMRAGKEKRDLRRQNDYLSEISETTQELKTTLNTMSANLRNDDEKYFNSSMYILLLTDSKEKLDLQIQKIRQLQNRFTFKINEVFGYQVESMNSAYLFGVQEIKRCCNMDSVSLAMLEPFRAQDINDPDGLYYGLNLLSKKAIVINRKNSRKYSGYHKLSFGGTGSGKTAQTKQEIALNALLYPEDQQIIIDPLGDYENIAEIFNGSLIKFETGKENYINPFDVDFTGVGYKGLKNIIKEKTDFVVAVLAAYREGPINKVEMGLIEDAVTKVFSDNYASRNDINGKKENKTNIKVPGYLSNNYRFGNDLSDLTREEQIRELSPLFQDIYEEIKRQDNEVSKKLVEEMFVLVNGSLNFFNHRTTIDLNKKVIVFSFDNSLKELRLVAETICLEVVKKLIRKNFKEGRWTEAYIDELHEFFRHQQILNTIVEMWKEMRHFNGMLGGITQDISQFFSNASEEKKEALIMLFSNTAFFTLSAQKATSFEYIRKYLPDINEALYTYILNSRAGTGLIKIGSVCVPFDNVINDTDSVVFNIIKTPEHDKEDDDVKEE